MAGVNEPRQRPSCTECALRLLAGRAHFRAELRRKLARRGYA
ncbi:MAG: regulatory protein RecX, partial [Myxococcota bacterium]